MEDIRQQVAAGAEHITFGDPDFLNGPTHGQRIVERLHAEFPSITYDITAKVEHLLKHREMLPTLRETGCLFVISAVESVQRDILEKLEKGHTSADFFELAGLFRDTGLTLTPTFLPFTPWTTIAGFRALLDAVEPPRSSSRTWLRCSGVCGLLIPSGSRLLELEDTRNHIGAFDERALVYPWQHPDSEVEKLAQRVSPQ